MDTPRSPSAKRTSKDQILLATRRLLKRQGYRRTSMDDIANEAGLAKATLYLHFTGKTEIVRNILRDCRAEIDTLARAAAELDDVTDALCGVVEAHLGTAIDWFGPAEHLRELQRLVADDPDIFRIPPETAMDKRLSDVVTAQIKRGNLTPRRADAVRTLVAVLLDCANGAKQGEATTAQDFQTRIRRAVPVLLTGLFNTGENSHAI